MSAKVHALHAESPSVSLRGNDGKDFLPESLESH